MGKKLGRRSISISGELYERVRKYCNEHDISASGLVTKLLVNYLEHGEQLFAHKESLPEKKKASTQKEEEKKDKVLTESGEERVVEEVIKETAFQARKSTRRAVNLKIHPPKTTSEPDRRGPGFMPVPKGKKEIRWRVIAELEMIRDTSDDALNGAITLLQNLVHKRLVNSAGILGVEQIEE